MSSIICNRNGVIEVSLGSTSRRDGAGPKENSLNSHTACEEPPYGEAVQSNRFLCYTSKFVGAVANPRAGSAFWFGPLDVCQAAAGCDRLGSEIDGFASCDARPWAPKADSIDFSFRKTEGMVECFLDPNSQAFG